MVLSRLTGLSLPVQVRKVGSTVTSPLYSYAPMRHRKPRCVAFALDIHAAAGSLQLL